MLSLSGEQSQCELAERMRIEAPTLVGVLDRMERDGWIQRVPDESDRRRNLVRPTPQVEPVWNKMIQCAKRVRGRATQDFSSDELETLRRLLARVRENVAAGQTADSTSGRAVLVNRPATRIPMISWISPPTRGGQPVGPRSGCGSSNRPTCCTTIASKVPTPASEPKSYCVTQPPA